MPPLRYVGLALLASIGCRPPLPPEDEGRIVAWRLVEIETAGGKALVFERIDGPSEERMPRIEARLSRRRAAVGAVVEAILRLPEADGLHRIRVRPSRPGVRILGPRSFDVRGPEPVTVRFTCETAGRGGILVIVRER